jgi:hypothetical protein
MATETHANETQANEKPVAVGVYKDLDSAEHTIETLRRSGFRAEEIGIAGHIDAKQPGTTPTALTTPEEYATQGMVAGGVLGAVVAVVVLLAIPGLAVLSGLGFGFELLAGAALGAAAGGVLVAFGTQVFPKTRARFLRRELDKGRYIVTVSNPQRRDEAASLLQREMPASEQKK